MITAFAYIIRCHDGSDFKLTHVRSPLADLWPRTSKNFRNLA